VSGPLLDGETVALKNCRHGPMLYLKRDLYVGRSLALYGEFSEIEAAFLASYAPADGVAVDAGANIGAHTLVLARAVGPRGMVIAAEPQRAVFQILCANLALNEIRNAHAFHCALGAAAGRTKIPAFDYRQENNYGGVSAGAERGETVRVQTVDGLSLPRLDLLKIDVEGWEAEVLRGAAASIKRHRPVLYVEADRMDKAPATVELMLSMGYAIYLHPPPLFNPKNFAGNAENVFGGTVSVNLLGIPSDRPRPVADLHEIKSVKDVNWQVRTPAPR
jgi:FkbM family methyltransferase